MKKILMVVHRFPPRHQAGAELYSYRLAKNLAQRHDLVVMSTDDNLSARNYSKRSYEYDDLRVIEFVNHRRYEEFEHSYADPRMDQHFASVLRAVQPDIVYYQHLLHHSVNYPAIAREFGCANIATLHEYWLLCGRNGQMVQASGARCESPALSKCVPCMANFMWGRRKIDVFMLRSLAGFKKVTGVDLKATARRLRLRSFDRGLDEIPDEVLAQMEQQLVLREARVRDCFEAIDCFLAPSRFLRERFVDFGLEADRILHNPLGVEAQHYLPSLRQTRGERPLRVGFLGSVQPIKGVHVLLEALAALPSESFEARIYGDMTSKPEYVRTLLQKARQTVRLMGRVDQSQVPEVLRSIDVLVVPSVWWENSPLVILEAFASGVPCVVSDIGGMAELVRDGQDGLHFKAGDSKDLAEQLLRLQVEAGLLEKLSRSTPRPRSIADDARFHDMLFDAVLNQMVEVEEEGF